ncbi:hypothetical protein LO872_000971 [Vibrio fluvialis]|nr:hypothetical protein [Vibrio fluvialis]
MNDGEFPESVSLGEWAIT